MASIQVELFGDEINANVIRTPGRKFPGIVIQGDSLSVLTSFAKSLVTSLANGEIAQASEDASELCELLNGYKSAYERALEKAGLELPYRSDR
jgi:hypothetical protein